MASQPANTVVGEIRADSSYTLSEFRRRTGLREWALRTAKRKGLRMLKVGRNKYVLGSDWIKYLEGLADPENER